MATYGKYIVGRTNGYSVEIWRKGWAGDEVNPSALAVDGLSLNLIDGDFDNVISKTTVDITFHDSEFKAYYDQFFTADATKYKLLIYEGSNPIWMGYITPDSYSYSTGSAVTITARDNLGYLEQIDFDMSGMHTIDEIIEEAQDRISWQAGAWTWVNPYSIPSLNGVTQYGDSIINCDHFEGTWFEMLEALLVGYQLRYVGANTWKIFEVTSLEQLPAVTHSQGIGASTWEVIPSWRTITTSQDFGLLKDLFVWKPKEEDFTFAIQEEGPFESTARPEYRSALYSNSKLGDALVLNNFDYNESKDPTSELYGCIMLGLSGITYRPFDTSKGFAYEPLSAPIVYSSCFGNGSKLGLKLTMDLYSFPIDFPGVSFNPTTYSPDSDPGIKILPKIKTIISYTTLAGDVYYLGEYWQEDVVIQELDLDELTPDSWSRAGRTLFKTETCSRGINIKSLPSDGGTLRVEISASCSVTYPYTFNDDGLAEQVARDLSAVAFKSITIEPMAGADSSGIELIGKINESGNIKSTKEVIYGETPTEYGGIGVFAYGLFGEDYDSLTGWRRSDGAGGLFIGLTENISRAYAHLSNAFYQDSERTGGLVFSGTLSNFAPSNLTINNLKYVLTDYQWVLTSNRATVTARQVTEYAYSADEWTQNVVTSGSKTPIGTGDNTALEWGTEGTGSATTKRLYELETDTSGEGAYILIDKMGNSSAKKLSIATIKSWINNKLDLAGGAITGALSIAKTLTVAGLTSLKSAIIDGYATIAGNLTVSGTTELKGTKVEGDLEVTNDIKATGDLEALGVTKLRDLLVSGKMTVQELLIQRASHIGGELVVSDGSMQSIEVEEIEGAYRCFFKATDGENTIYNQFKVGDQARAKTFNLASETEGETSNHYYWRKVVAVGADYIDLSIAQCAEGSDAPLAGDDITLLGSSDPDRQGAIIISSQGSPSIKIYEGIDSFTLPVPEIVLSPSGTRISSSSIVFGSSSLDDKLEGLDGQVNSINSNAQQSSAFRYYEISVEIENIDARCSNTNTSVSNNDYYARIDKYRLSAFYGSVHTSAEALLDHIDSATDYSASWLITFSSLYEQFAEAVANFDSYNKAASDNTMSSVELSAATEVANTILGGGDLSYEAIKTAMSGHPVFGIVGEGSEQKAVFTAAFIATLVVKMLQTTADTNGGSLSIMGSTIKMLKPNGKVSNLFTSNRDDTPDLAFGLPDYDATSENGLREAANKAPLVINDGIIKAANYQNKNIELDETTMQLYADYSNNVWSLRIDPAVGYNFTVTRWLSDNFLYLSLPNMGADNLGTKVRIINLAGVEIRLNTKPGMFTDTGLLGMSSIILGSQNDIYEFEYLRIANTDGLSYKYGWLRTNTSAYNTLKRLSILEDDVKGNSSTIGSGSGGYYRKWSDGRMMCYGVIQSSASTGTVVFPHSFKNSDYAIVVAPRTSQYQNSAVCQITVTSRSASSFNWGGYKSNSSSHLANAGQDYVSYIAFGEYDN